MSAPSPSPFVFVGNHRLLDFLNTEVAVEGTPRDLLAAPADLVDWLEQAGAVDRTSARTARTRWGTGRAGDALVRQARSLRASLRRIADAAAAGRPVPRAAIAPVNALLERSAAVDRLTAAAPDGFMTRRDLRLRQPPDLLVPIAEAAADFLCHADLGRVRRCAHPACVLYFLDGTKNGTRRWCDMRTCGNRANAAAYYRRHHGSA
jgi:predicted RNA-binding Zn ribbon-like protein